MTFFVNLYYEKEGYKNSHSNSYRNKKIDPKAKVILFGSRARGDARHDSDWDILILIKDTVTPEKESTFRYKLFDLELETGEVFSTFVYNTDTWNKKHKVTPFYKSIKQEGILL